MKVEEIITVNVVIFAKGFSLKFARKIEKRPHTHFLTKQAILWKQKIEIQQNLQKWILGMETI